MRQIQFTAGRLICGRIRHFLETCRFQGMDIQWLESPGWLRREFVVNGSEEDLLVIIASLEEWAEECGLNNRQKHYD